MLICAARTASIGPASDTSPITVPVATTEQPETEAAAPSFTLELNQDQKDIRDWVHGFAEGVVRPAAEEWDEREETPWPIIQEAARAGIYSLDFFASSWGDESGISLPITMEGFKTLAEGEEVEFEVKTTDKGLQAASVARVQ